MGLTSVWSQKIFIPYWTSLSLKRQEKPRFFNRHCAINKGRGAFFKSWIEHRLASKGKVTCLATQEDQSPWQNRDRWFGYLAKRRKVTCQIWLENSKSSILSKRSTKKASAKKKLCQIDRQTRWIISTNNASFTYWNDLAITTDVMVNLNWLVSKWWTWFCLVSS